jgi:hypothetical protein
LMAVPIETSSSFHAGTPTSLFNEVYDLRSNSGQTYTVDSRGGRFLMIRPPKEDSSAHIRVVVNWFEELRRLVPAKKNGKLLWLESQGLSFPLYERLELSQ